MTQTPAWIAPATSELDAQAGVIAASVAQPRIPDRTLRLLEETNFRPGPEPEHDFAPEIQSLLDRLAAAGGGTLILGHPRGAKAWLKTPVTYRVVGPLHLRSRTRLALEPSVRLLFSFEPSAYFNGGRGHLTRYEGTLLYGPSACLRAFRCEDVEICALPGSGAMPEIDGSGFAWQRWMEDGEQTRKDKGLVPSYQRLKSEINNAGLPLSERQCGDCSQWFLRPELFQALASRRIRMAGIRITHAPFWCLHPVFSEDVTFQNLTFNARAINNDGIDPESCRRVLIERIVFDNADDNVAIKAGRDREAREGLDIRGSELDGADVPWIRNGRTWDHTSEVVVRNCCFKGHYAVCIGSEVGGGASDIHVLDNLAPQDVKMLFNIKSSRSRGGVVERVFLRRFRAHEATDHILCLVPNYDNDATSPFPPTFRQILIEDVTVDQAKHGVALYGWPDALTRDVTLRRILCRNLEGSALAANHVQDVSIESVLLGRELTDTTLTRSSAGDATPHKI